MRLGVTMGGGGLAGRCECAGSRVEWLHATRVSGVDRQGHKEHYHHHHRNHPKINIPIHPNYPPKNKPKSPTQPLNPPTHSLNPLTQLLKSPT